MATWNIISIQATPNIACVSSTGYVIFPKEYTIWDSTKNYNDSDTGSTVPVMFRTLSTPVSDPMVPIRLAGTCEFPATWAGGKYILSALAGSNTTVLQSEELDVPPNSGQNVVVKNFHLLMSSAVSCPLPFRWAGDFTWTISLVGFPQDVLSASAKTRLELCWARAPAPAGPVNPLSPDVPSRVDLTPGYPIWLFRLFAPCPTEFPAAPGDLLDFYIQRAMDAIWNPGSTIPRYDTTHGAPSYNMNILGGSFNLDCWIKKLYPSCNCYDLAGIAQLACTILVDDSGNELVDSRFVFQDPNGYVNPGPLFGWVALGGDHLRCNTPLWKDRHTGPYVEPKSEERSPFRYHAWVEITRSGIRGVLDATHASEGNPIPYAGTLDRVAYLSQTIDPTRSKIDPSTRVNNKGACWINPDTQLFRIGVMDASGLPNPDPPEFLRLLPDDMRQDLESTVEMGKSPQQPTPQFNEVNVHPRKLIDKFFPGSGFVHQRTAIYVAPTVTQVVVKLKPKSIDDIESVNLTISTFDSIQGPISALTSYLLGFQSKPLSSFISRCDPPLGAFSFCTRNSVFWVRGNQFLLMQQFDSPAADPSKVIAQKAAVEIDQYISVSGKKIWGGPPHFSPVKPPKDKPIYRGQTFTVSLLDSDVLLNEKQARSADTSIVLPGGPPSTAKGEFEFYAVGVGSTEITIHGADAKTLRPGKVTRRVTVLPSL